MKKNCSSNKIQWCSSNLSSVGWFPSSKEMNFDDPFNLDFIISIMLFYHVIWTSILPVFNFLTKSAPLCCLRYMDLSLGPCPAWRLRQPWTVFLQVHVASVAKQTVVLGSYGLCMATSLLTEQVRLWTLFFRHDF